MSLLRDIQNGAVGTDSSVTVLLRQCLVLAARLQNEQLREWAQLELNGYPADVDLPVYRPKVTTQVLGDFSGPFGSSAQNMGLARSAVPEELQDALFTTEIRESVAQIEELVASGETSFHIPWPMDVVGALQDKFMANMNLMGARQIVPVTVFAGTLSGIRDRIVQFALDIEEVNPSAGEAEPGERPIEPGRVTQIFNQTFQGDNTAFAAAGHTVRQSQATTTNLTTITETLEAFGIPEQERALLLDAIEEEGVLAGAEPGEKTRRWMERLEQGAITVGTGLTVQTVVAALSVLLGLS